MKKILLFLLLLPTLVCAQKIVDLPAASNPSGTEVTAVSQGAVTKKMTVNQIRDYTHANIDFAVAIVNKPTTLAGYGITDGVNTSRTITINSESHNLSSNPTFTVIPQWNDLIGVPAPVTALSGTNTGDQDLSGLAVKSNNLSDLTNAGTARTNLGLGTLATQSGTFSGTSSGTNTGDQTITLTSDVTGSGSGSFAATVNAAMNKTWTGTHVFSTVSPSAPANTTSERFGAGAVLSTFTESSVFGNGATAGMRGSTAYGYQSVTILNEYDFNPSSAGGPATVFGTGSGGQGLSLGPYTFTGDRENIAIGPKSRAEGTGAGVGAPALIAIGDWAEAAPIGANGNEIVMGDYTKTTGNINFLIGGGGTIQHDFVACYGCQGSDVTKTFDFSTRDHQFIMGGFQPSSSYFSGGAGLYNEFLFGPEFATNPHALEIYFNSINGGSNLNAPTVTFKAPRATGTGSPGTFIWQTSNTGSSGSTVQTLVNRLTMNGGIGDLLVHTGSVKVQSASNAGTAVNTLTASTSNYGANSTTGSGFYGYNTYIDDAGSFQRDNTGASAAGLYMTNASSEFLQTFQFITSGGTATYPFTVQGAGSAHLMAGTQLGWTSSTTSSRGAIDTGLLRDGAADVRVTTGPTLNGNGSIRSDEKVVPKTTNYTVLFTDTESFFTNTGAAGTVNFTLPTAAVGRTFTFYVDVAQSLTITAGASTTIRIGANASAAAGNITSNTIGNSITLVATSTTQWVAKSHEGTWTIN